MAKGAGYSSEIQKTGSMIIWGKVLAEEKWNSPWNYKNTGLKAFFAMNSSNITGIQREALAIYYCTHKAKAVVLRGDVLNEANKESKQACEEGIATFSR